MTMRTIRDFDRWVRLTITVDSSGLHIAYEDERGATAIVHQNQHPTQNLNDSSPSLPMAGDVLFTELAALLRGGYEDRVEMRSHRLPKGGELLVPWLLPVFIRPPQTGYFPWESWLERQLPRENARWVLMREGTPYSPRPLGLPIRIAGLLPDKRLFEGIRASDWYRHEPSVEAYGLRMAYLGDSQVDNADIVFRLQHDADDGTFVRTVRPQLVVTFLTRRLGVTTRDAQLREPGSSHLLVLIEPFGHPAYLAADFVMHFIYALVHDFAVHEIAWIIERTVPYATCLTITDAVGNQALRLSHVMRDLVDDARAGKYGPVEHTDELLFDFTRETRGLTAMTRFLARTDVLRNADPFNVAAEPATRADYGPSDAAGGVATSPPPPNKVSNSTNEATTEVGVRLAPERKVDVSMDSYDAFGVLVPLLRWGRGHPLRRGWRYRLQIHIGSPDPHRSIMDGDIPSIDDLLPPNPAIEVRVLEIVVYAKTFELLTPAVQKLGLPPARNSAPVFFELRAPQEAGPADLRIAVYLNNNLLQSFVLEAQVTGDTHEWSADTSLRVRLDSSGIERFDDLAHVTPRALSIALNDDVKAGSHTLMVKGEGWAKEVPLYSEAMNEKMNEFRELLRDAGSPAPSDIVRVLRRLAVLGRQIRSLLSFGKQEHAQALDAISRRADATLQFVRHHGGRPFPWQAVYDYTLPTGLAFANARICFGGPVAAEPFDPKRPGCPHCPGQPVICIEGFWLVRHRLELLSEHCSDKSPSMARASRACAPLPNPLVMLGIGTASGQAALLRQSLENRLKTELATITIDDAPVADLLWNMHRRPAMLIVLSHLFNRDPELNLPLRLLTFAPETDGARICVDDLADRQGRGHWHPYRPLVMLMACESARRDTGELIGLVDAFLESGAAAVVGTEWNVDTATVSSFVEHVVHQTLDRSATVPLGVAIQRYARIQLKDKNIAPFIFTTYGSADLTVGRPNEN